MIYHRNWLSRRLKCDRSANCNALSHVGDLERSLYLTRSLCVYLALIWCPYEALSSEIASGDLNSEQPVKAQRAPGKGSLSNGAEIWPTIEEEETKTNIRQQTAGALKEVK